MQRNEDAPHGFRRQVTLRIGPADAPLLELAARAHGGIQAGLLAALRAYAAERLQPVPSPTKPAAFESKPNTEPEPAKVEHAETVELNISEAAEALGTSAASLRERIKRGSQPGRTAYTAAVVQSCASSCS